MSLDLFRPLPESRAKGAGRRLSALPLSVFLHVLVVLGLVVIPLLAKDILPQPPIEDLEWTPAVPAPPSPPPPAVSARAAAVDVPPQNPDAAPPEAPSGILPEDGLIRTAPPAGLVTDTGVVPGTPGGIEGVVPGVADTPPPPPVTPVRPGGKIKEPQRIVYVAPFYPEVARIAHVDGTVILEAVIGPDGVVRDVRVLRSKALLDEAAMAAVRQWRYTPTLLNGVPVAVVMTVTVTFRLQ
jgi:protein TonB